MNYYYGGSPRKPMFGDLASLDVFKYESHLYVKLSGAFVAGGLSGVFGANAWNSVSLSNGGLYTFQASEIVEPLPRATLCIHGVITRDKP